MITAGCCQALQTNGHRYARREGCGLRGTRPPAHAHTTGPWHSARVVCGDETHHDGQPMVYPIEDMIRY